MGIKYLVMTRQQGISLSNNTNYNKERRVFDIETIDFNCHSSEIKGKMVVSGGEIKKLYCYPVLVTHFELTNSYLPSP